ncbi:MAG: RHS repeat-associated core domain-containing protein, partial [Burkholderiales bacterium]|nr:RHS repeat-associated core domain-containing protein [Burkholderiales bacterium]
SLMTGLNLDEMLARVTTLNATNTTQARTYLTDALGSVMAQTQDNQSTLAGYSYSPYGQTQSTGNTEGDSVQYTARENDHNGLYYYRARYYDPVLKRFLSEDPIGLAGGSLSFYTYVNGNPVMFTDPEGLSAVPSLPPMPNPNPSEEKENTNTQICGLIDELGRNMKKKSIPGISPPDKCPKDPREFNRQYQEGMAMCQAILNVPEKVLCFRQWRDWGLKCVAG